MEFILLFCDKLVMIYISPSNATVYVLYVNAEDGQKWLKHVAWLLNITDLCFMVIGNYYKNVSKLIIWKWGVILESCTKWNIFCLGIILKIEDCEGGVFLC